MALPECGARTRAGTPCKRPAGWGTDHVGSGKCKLHGGKSPGVPGNKNALKTGEYETIWFDQLDAEERLLYDRVNTSVLRQIDDEIRLLTIRERRMLARIANLLQADMTTVEESEVREKSESVVIQDDGDIAVADVVKTTKKRLATLGQIQDIEEALTRVQDKKAKMLELKHKIESGEGLTKPEMRQYLEALSKVATDVWSEDE